MLFEPDNTCEICGHEEKSLSLCKMCHAGVCESCFDSKSGMCIACQEAQCQICGEYLASRACNTCGRLVCEDHGVKINESTLCDICRKSDQ